MENWRKVRFFVFDLPHSEKPFRERMEEMKTLKMPENCVLANYEKCENERKLEEFLMNVIEAGGEGVLLQRVDDRREHEGRTHRLPTPP